jgi:hypothetical protein
MKNLSVVACVLAVGLSAHAQSAYQGVSRPPADDVIEATPEAVPVPTPAPATEPVAKPSPAVPYAAATAPPVENPDYGIVSSVSSTGATSTGSGTPHAALVTRTEDPDYGIVGLVASPSNQLAEGTNVHVRMVDELSTTTTQSGAPFRAQVSANVYKDGRVVIPVGSELRGRVVGVSQGHHFGRSATLRLRPDLVVLPDGSAYHLFAQVVSSEARGTKTDNEGGVEPSSQLVKNVAEYGAGSGGGAVAGAVIAGPPGALGGAVIGAGIVTTHLLLQHPRQARLEQGSEVTFSLSEPMDLVPTRN